MKKNQKMTKTNKELDEEYFIEEILRAIKNYVNYRIAYIKDKKND